MADQEDHVTVSLPVGHAAMVRKLCLRESRRLRRLATKRPFTPAPGKTDANVTAAFWFEVIANQFQRPDRETKNEG